jgi:hemoglobin-like flavoprotein
MVDTWCRDAAGFANPSRARAMTPHQIDLVRHSFAAVAPIAEQAAALFYDNLFAADPQLKPLFRSDMGHQGQRLMTMIGAAVGLLDQPQKLMPVLRSLGLRHAAYGVQAHHYDTVGSALLTTLGQGLGDAFTPDVRAAWAAMYMMVATEMQSACEPVAA